jgi:alpha 1,3-glucosidase
VRRGARRALRDLRLTGALSQEGHPDGAWEEKYNSHTDSKPKGPQSLSVDLRFPGAPHAYGIPEHASALALAATRGANGTALTEPFRLYALDVYEYLADSPFGLYGAIPLLLAHAPGPQPRTVGAFWLNAAEQYVDITPAAGGGTDAHWFTESGLLDLFLLPGPGATDVWRQYAGLTGAPAMPARFALGYHQCRWNYRDEPDVEAVDAGFDEHDIPYDVIWLDIEHTNGKRYMTWDARLFPTPERLQRLVASHGERKTVTIIDPHVKRDDGFAMHAEATRLGLYVKNADGVTDFDGWCWPGSSSYLDVSNATVRDWWARQFAFDKYVGSTEHLHVWNDMNEPSVFNGPEVTMQKDLRHAGGAEHRDVHNAYGMYYHAATTAGLATRSPEQRPFVLSRAFFAGA